MCELWVPQRSSNGATSTTIKHMGNCIRPYIVLPLNSVVVACFLCRRLNVFSETKIYNCTMNAQRAFGGAAAAGCLYQQQQPASASEEGFNRFASLNVSRHPTTASLQNQTRRWETRPSLQPLEDPRSKPQPTLPARQRPHPALQEDVEGSHPMRLHYPRSGHKDWSDISDIPLTTSKAVAFGKGGRRVDPLEPRYALPSSPPPSIPEPAFKRDSHSVADIPGAQPRQKRTLKERGPPPVLEVRRNRLCGVFYVGSFHGWMGFNTLQQTMQSTSTDAVVLFSLCRARRAAGRPCAPTRARAGGRCTTWLTSTTRAWAVCGGRRGAQTRSRRLTSFIAW